MKKNVTTFFSLFFLSINIFAADQKFIAPETSGALTLFVYPPRYTLDWASPKTFATTLMRNMLVSRSGNANRYKSSEGHSILYLSCKDLRGEAHDLWSGLTGQNDLSLDRENVFDKNLGLSVVFKTYRDGEIQGEKNQRNKVGNYRGRHGVKPLFVRLSIRPEQCEFLVEMEAQYRRRSWDTVTPVREWIRRPDDQVLHYGVEVADPLVSYLESKAGRSNKLGGGCTSYAASFLKAINFWGELFERRFVRTVNISEKLLGHENHPVTLQDILKSDQWVYPGYATRREGIYDPELMWDFFIEVRRCAANPQSSDCSPEVLAWTQRHQGQANYFDKTIVMADRTEWTWSWNKRSQRREKIRRAVKVPVEVEGMTIGGMEDEVLPRL